jgi:hypothetical protein
MKGVSSEVRQVVRDSLGKVAGSMSAADQLEVAEDMLIVMSHLLWTELDAEFVPPDWLSAKASALGGLAADIAKAKAQWALVDLLERRADES